MRKKLFNIFIITALMGFLLSGILSGYINSAVYAAESDDIADQEQVMPFLMEPPELSDEYKIVETYETEWPDVFGYNMQYNEYDVFPIYVVNLSGSRRKIYETPDSSEGYYGKLSYGSKLQLLALVENEGELWYAVIYEYEDKPVVGYIQEDKVSKREFQLHEISMYLENVRNIQNLGHIVYVENYKNMNGTAPRLPNGSYYDEFGNRRGQAIAGYYDETLDGEFRYIPDGTLGIVEQVIELSEPKEEIIVIDNKGLYTSQEEFFNTEDEPISQSEATEQYNENTEVIAVKIYVPSFDTALWVKEKYLNEDEDAPDVLNQAIIVDRLNQNIAVFEYDGQWNLISLSYSSTGKTGEFSIPTPLGYFMAINKKIKFDYVEDGTTTIVGFAPYAIRFTAGGYLHGVPMSYAFDELGQKVNVPSNNYYEYLSSIGTIPKSHMCVRNYTSHAEFMYEWVDIGNCTVIVIE